ncbi:MAG: peptide deformylase [Brachybacterium sp.]|nr:peptide deformylase [Brachybacterium sp.]
MDLSALVTKTLERRERPTDPLRITQAGHPALRARSRPWSGQLAPALLTELVEAMVITMREAPGVGLAAPQVGIPLQLMVIEDRIEPEEPEEPEADDLAEGVSADPLRRSPVDLRVLLNPTYASVGPRRALFWEGCLSVRGWQSIVPRHLTVRWEAQERLADGRIVDAAEEWTGWPARIMQHETDHCAGTLCHDLAVPRSFVEDRYTGRYADLEEAVRWLGLEGPVTELQPGSIEIDLPT